MSSNLTPSANHEMTMLIDYSRPPEPRDWFGTILLSFMAVSMVAIIIFCYLGYQADRRQAERDYATCQSRGLDMTNLIQGSGKNVTSKHLCVAKDGTLYAL